MGQSKALLQIRNKPLVNLHVDALRTVCRNIVVVVGGQAEAVQTVLDPDIIVVHNPNWADTHMSDSLRMGLEGCHGVALVTPIDCEPAPEHVLHALAKAGAPAVTQFQQEDGHPVLIDVAKIRASTGTLQEVLRTAQRIPLRWSGALHNWNTPDQWSDYSSPPDPERN